MARPAESNVQGGDGRDDVNEGVDDGSMPGQIEGRELLDVADDGLGHVPGIEQSFRGSFQ